MSRERATMVTSAEEVPVDRQKEGNNLLGKPTFQQLENGRFKCVETGHEMPIHAKESYANSKRCRVGLIDFALANKKSPLNMFKQDPLCRSKVICRLTGDTVNKSEEHIWKHINGRRFLNKLEQMEAGTLSQNGKNVEEKSEVMEAEGGSKGKVDSSKKKKKMTVEKRKKAKTKEEIVSEMRESLDDSDVGKEGEELDFWMPPIGERWDFDDGRDRWASDADSDDEEDDQEDNGIDDTAMEEKENASELSKRTKRMSIEIGPSSFASRKKKRDCASIRLQPDIVRRSDLFCRNFVI